MDNSVVMAGEWGIRGDLIVMGKYTVNIKLKKRQARI